MKAYAGNTNPSSLTRTATIALLRPQMATANVLDAFERLLWWLFAGSAGAKTRAEVIRAIKEEPKNAQQLSQALSLDYTTVRHHLKVLEQNRIVVTEGDPYGKLYFLSDAMEAHWGQLEAILERVGRRGRR
ncbi:MAG: winged helix-turn-helix domain-containing protein [Thaumarchaeota archaeon]|nr:winged helix-turn-helix domain-containing protein [Nitrososphaerota archaeon]